MRDTGSQRFSERHGYATPDAEITVRHDAPHDFRGVLLEIAYECGLSPKAVRSIVCRVLRTREDPNNWSDPNVWGEVTRLVDDCDWFQVYDIAEAVYESLHRHDDARAEQFSSELNSYFHRAGIGWQLVNGKVQVRGSEAFEETVGAARDALDEENHRTAASEIHEALRDLSRRPTPDATGAVQHAMAALECVAGDVTGDPKATLGDIIKRNPNLFQPPLDQAMEKLWGYTSQRGRHLREGREPSADEAELVVGLASVMATHLTRKSASKPRRGGSRRRRGDDDE
jgi:hypothetical protein